VAESSIGWNTDGTGDGTATGYTSAQFINWIRLLTMDASDEQNYGVIFGYWNGLTVSNTSANHMKVDTGAAIVYGFPYWNTSAVTLDLTTPSIGTTGWRIVLRADWATQTVRAKVLMSPDGTPAYPAMTRTNGVAWDIPLAYGTITTSNVVTLMDGRKFMQSTGRWDATTNGRNHLASGFFDAATILAKFAEDSVTNAVLLKAIKDGAFQADDSTRALFQAGFLGATPAGRAIIGSGYFDPTTVADKFMIESITAAQMANRTRTLFVPAVAGYGIPGRRYQGRLGLRIPRVAIARPNEQLCAGVLQCPQRLRQRHGD
jgi:hypothetical protein